MKKVTVTGLWIRPDHKFGSTDGGTAFGNCLLAPEIKVKERLTPLGFEFFSEEELPLDAADVILCVDINEKIWTKIQNLPNRIVKIFQACESPIYSPMSYALRSGVLTWKGWTFILTWSRGMEMDNMTYYDIPFAGIDFLQEKNTSVTKKMLGVSVVSKKKNFCGISWGREKLLLQLSAMGEIDLYGQGWSVNSKKHQFGSVSNKINSMKGYQFGLAMENCYEYGYVTEKLPDCILAGLPSIYWGDPESAQRRFPDTFVPLADLTLDAFFEAKNRLLENYESLLENTLQIREESMHWCDSYIDVLEKCFLKIASK